MAKTKKPDSQINQGGINITGNVQIKNSKIAGRDNVEKKVINVNTSFASVYNALEDSKTIPLPTKNAVKKNIKQIEQEIKKGDKAEASFVQKRLKNIQKMAPDIAEVVIATLQNPAIGISLAVKKVANKFNTNRTG